ncbi:F-box protein [Seminavis robusta]|uniref:F-box protein n=1 Tax=Seminavis robusta TaxID=568900 RepID=A0A9N8EAW7_9STRA|nr:F-box protein [Seminavis robusta]|eukprot:Sro699_g189530.1 F-box protein (493) ;mRNA; f:46749-48227
MASTSTDTSVTTNSSKFLEGFCSTEDFFHHFVPYLTYQDVGRLESVSKRLQTLAQESMWKVVCRRDFNFQEDDHDMIGPTYHQERRSFDRLEKASNWKYCYHKWWFWTQWTGGKAKPHHLREAIALWARCRAVLTELGLQNVVDSLCPGLDRREFSRMFRARNYHKCPLPSSLIASYSVRAGQQELSPLRPQVQDIFSGLFGSFSCYDDLYSLRLVNVRSFQNPFSRVRLMGVAPIILGINCVTVGNNPPTYLFLRTTPEDPEGQLAIAHDYLSYGEKTVVGQGGFLAYLRQYVEHLEAGIYKRVQFIDEDPSSHGIGLFPDGGPTMSCAITRGIEVRASARWFPARLQDQQGQESHFGYNIRIRMVDPDPEFDTCQLVSQHLQFMDGNGKVQRVHREAVDGKQPVFFQDATAGRPGYIDMGPAGDGDRFEDKTFVYQSDTGPVAGTSLQDTKLASIKGTFRFVPGTISNPKGPEFHVVLASFPLTVPMPFY